MDNHAVRWYWYEYVWGMLLAGLAGLSLLVALAALGEHERQALVVATVTAIVLLAVLAAAVVGKRRGSFETVRRRRALAYGLTIPAMFAVSLVVRSDYSLQQKDVHQPGNGEQKYDATTQPGNELLNKLEKAVDKDVLTFSIYDVCVGKISHKVSRDGPVNPEQVQVLNRHVLTEKIKADAIALGADVVGITELDQRFVFSRDNDGNSVRLPHKYAIVIGKGLSYRLASPSAPLPWSDRYSSIPEEVAAAVSGKPIRGAVKLSPEAVKEMRDTLEFFQDGGRIAVQLAKEIRSYGYPARAHFGRWSEVQVIPVAVAAGLGELGKNGVLINKEFGPRGSFPVVTTDLPLVPDRQVDLGIQEFCRACNKCSRACPVQAIPYGAPVKENGVPKWPVDGQKCWSFIKGNPKCMSCMGSCPYNKKNYLVHRLAVWLIGRKSVVANRLLAKLDDALGYGQSAFTFKQQSASAAAEALRSLEPTVAARKPAGDKQ